MPTGDRYRICPIRLIAGLDRSPATVLIVQADLLETDVEVTVTGMHQAELSLAQDTD